MLPWQLSRLRHTLDQKLEKALFSFLLRLEFVSIQARFSRFEVKQVCGLTVKTVLWEVVGSSCVVTLHLQVSRCETYDKAEVVIVGTWVSYSV